MKHSLEEEIGVFVLEVKFLVEFVVVILLCLVLFLLALYFVPGPAP